MRLTNDDAISRFQGRWIDAQGSQMWVIARYSAWGVFAALVLPIFAVLRIIVRFDLIMAVFFAVGIAAFLAKLAADMLVDEYGVGSWFRLFISNRLTNVRRKQEHPKRQRPRRLI